jgi:hypothetical protein
MVMYKKNLEHLLMTSETSEPYSFNIGSMGLFLQEGNDLKNVELKARDISKNYGRRR